MVARNILEQYLNEYLDCAGFNDLGPNGLQVEGRESIYKIITAVSAGVELFEKAIEQKADAIIVHHGIIWNFERPVYKGGYKKRVKLLLENDVNLFGHHLPLDAHMEVGNNAEIARVLGVRNPEPFGEYNGRFDALHYAGASGADGAEAGTHALHVLRPRIMNETRRAQMEDWTATLKDNLDGINGERRRS
jgi:putative NIF3 family GTP cyclohydrolase 1 type 2